MCVSSPVQTSCPNTYLYRFTIHSHSLETMTAAWLLPIVTLTVAASSGGVISLQLSSISPIHAIITTTTSVVLVTIGLTLALMVITIYMHRLIVHGLPPGPKILSVFLPLGPTAQSGYAILLIGKNFRTLFPFNIQNQSSSEFFGSSSVVGETIYVISVCASFLLWSLAVMCILFACLAIYDTIIIRHTRVPFALTFWGLVFPNGVFANLTINLSKIFDSAFFRVLGSIYAVLTLLVWIFVATRTVQVVYDRSIFQAVKDDEDKVISDPSFNQRTRSESREPLRHGMHHSIE
ncbi:hypothetical protein H0H93_003499 [Arthromyces matolae]|nr:hypothetical protein H0H93_003499 [Arthromyces matolae]